VKLDPKDHEEGDNVFTSHPSQGKIRSSGKPVDIYRVDKNRNALYKNADGSEGTAPADDLDYNPEDVWHDFNPANTPADDEDEFGNNQSQIDQQFKDDQDALSVAGSKEPAPDKEYFSRPEDPKFNPQTGEFDSEEEEDSDEVLGNVDNALGKIGMAMSRMHPERQRDIEQAARESNDTGDLKPLVNALNWAGVPKPKAVQVARDAFGVPAPKEPGPNEPAVPDWGKLKDLSRFKEPKSSQPSSKFASPKISGLANMGKQKQLDKLGSILDSQGGAFATLSKLPKNDATKEALRDLGWQTANRLSMEGRSFGPAVDEVIAQQAEMDRDEGNIWSAETSARAYDIMRKAQNGATEEELANDILEWEDSSTSDRQAFEERYETEPESPWDTREEKEGLR
jgi:hypothetical protein